MKKKAHDLSEKELIETLDILYTAAGTVRGRKAMKLFLRDLLTPSERVMLGRRIWIARLLIAGDTCSDIEKRLKVGRATIYRVDRWLKDQFPGFEQAVGKMEDEMGKRSIRAAYSFAALKRKYPLHFLLFPTPKNKRKSE
ncbi:MAG: hypothetical protein KGI73_03660 [Patescibacteria group bacterium]|nr:hypothetical protein [Patescibacteria group bacterium]